MNLWRKILCSLLLTLILGSAFSTYSNANSFKIFQEKKSSNCSILIGNGEDDINFESSEITLTHSQQVFFILEQIPQNFISLPVKVFKYPTTIQLRVFRI